MKTWVVARAIIETFNPMVKQCVLNQTQGFWLLSNALQVALTISVKLHVDVDRRTIVEPLLQRGNCVSKLEILYNCMATKVVKVLAPFLLFVQNFQRDKAHNMMALMLDLRYNMMAFMLDLRFKGLTCVCEFVGKKRAMKIVHEYD